MKMDTVTMPIALPGMMKNDCTGAPASSGRCAITVFTPYYAASTAERQAELDLCLERNLACTAIDQLVLLIDDGHAPPFEHAKLRIVEIDARPTYADWARLTRKFAAHGVSVLANSDIYFDESLLSIRQCITGPEKFLALSRYDKQGDNFVAHPNAKWSQDVWAVHTQASLPPALLNALDDVPLGVPRCDNKVAYLFCVRGWQVYNPLHHLRSIHVHETQQRNYDKKSDLTVVGSVAYVHPSPTLGEPSQLEVDVWARGSKAITGVSLNRSLDNWFEQARNGSAAALRTSDAPGVVAPTVSGPITRSKSGAAASVPPIELNRVIGSAEVTYRDALGRFHLYRNEGKLLAVDRLDLANTRTIAHRGQALTPELLLSAFIPPVFSTKPITIADRPLSPTDHHFWQYPAATERQALLNHMPIREGANVDAVSRTVHTYLGLPWATYIDKQHLPDEVLAYVVPRIMGLRRLAEEHGYRLAVHSVCQQIYWRRFVEIFATCGITDLHISHALRSLDPKGEGLPFCIHSWPLIAPNVEDPSRNAGLVVGKPLQEKKYFASFIGAHMPHYRSDIRPRLLEAAKASGRRDVVVDLGSEWHFNKVVYQEQVKSLQLTGDENAKQLASARRYNEMLSDSIFSLCPEGAGPNTLRVGESLAAGSIPVILADDWLPPQPTSGEPDLESCCVFVPMRDVAETFARLSAIPRTRLETMQRLCIQHYGAARQRTCFAAGPAAQLN
jgi:hypothetical protein